MALAVSFSLLHPGASGSCLAERRFLTTQLKDKEQASPRETQGTWVRSLGWEDPLEKEMATRSSILA